MNNYYKNEWNEELRFCEDENMTWLEYALANGEKYYLVETNDIDLTSEEGIKEQVELFMNGEFDLTQECWTDCK